jgi:hypothetical protein
VGAAALVLALEVAQQAEVACDRAHLVALLVGDEADAEAAGAGAAGSPDAVGVGVAIGRSVELDHVGDLGDVDPAGGDVGRDQGRDLAALKAGQRALAL